MTSVPEAPVPAKVQLSRVVLNQADIDRALTRIAHEILESNKGSQDLVLLGIPRRGYPLAVRLAAKIAAADPGLYAPFFAAGVDVLATDNVPGAAIAAQREALRRRRAR